MIHAEHALKTLESKSLLYKSYSEEGNKTSGNLNVYGWLLYTHYFWLGDAHKYKNQIDKSQTFILLYSPVIKCT